MSTGGDGSAQRKENSNGHANGDNSTKPSLHVITGHGDPQVIRQDRIAASENNWKIFFKNHELKILNYSAFGLACVSDKKIDDQVWENCVITQKSLFRLEDLTFKVVRVKEQGTHFEYGLETVSASLPVITMNHIVSLSSFISSLDEADQLDAKLVPENARLIVYQLREVFRRTELYIDQKQKDIQFGNFNDKQKYEESVISFVGEWLYENIKKCNDKLNFDSQSLDTEQLNRTLKFYRETLHQFVYQSTFADRALTKPLGYAGDYEMMNLIYRDEDFAKTLFGQCIERAFLRHPEPQAVRNRAQYLCRKIEAQLLKKPDSRLISIACGPAHELHVVLNKLDPELLKKATFVLLDQDLDALKNAQFNILTLAKKKGIKLNIELLHLSIKNVITTGLGAGIYDLVYSAGLFDYFQDDVARMAAKRLVDSAKANGTVIIGNFDISTPNKFGMKIVFDWDLIYRSEENLKRLYSFPKTQNTVEHEENKINLFSVITKE